VAVPTIGIGAGPDTDGQILVTPDLLGLTPDFRPRFVRRYAELGETMATALSRFAEEVRSGRFPGDEESFE
jgi:3-methyl-2-oxobutanoate hydroxymethyltransferase